MVLTNSNSLGFRNRIEPARHLNGERGLFALLKNKNSD
jgi:hypothetical protein